MDDHAVDVKEHSLAEVFRCFICLEKLNDARLCPHCSKLCCFSCISRWLTEQRAQCPHCRASLHLHELVNCHSAEEVTQQLDTVHLHGSSYNSEEQDKDICEEHRKKLRVYCSTCLQCICHQCALWHSGHTFKPLDKVYDEHLSHLNKGVNHFERRHFKLMDLVQEVVRNMASVIYAKDKCASEIFKAAGLMIDRLESQFKTKFTILAGQRQQLSREAELLESVLIEVDHQKKSCSKQELIKRSGDLLQMFAQVHRKPMASFVTAPVPADFISEIVPQYDSSIFVMNNFSILQQRADPVYSQPLNVSGLGWRLKVYPDGRGIDRGNYLSVFLQLTCGLRETSKYEYRVEMVHQLSKDPSKNIVRGSASDFKVGECWGCYRFFRLDLLASKGYLNTKDDTLILSFQVRPPTFCQKSRDQQWYITQLETVQQQCQSQMNDLKEMLHIELSHNKATKKDASQGIGCSQSCDTESHAAVASRKSAKGIHLHPRSGEMALIMNMTLEAEQENDEDNNSSRSSNSFEGTTDMDLTQEEFETGPLDDLETSNNENDLDEEIMFGDNDVENKLAWDDHEDADECKSHAISENSDCASSTLSAPTSSASSTAATAAAAAAVAARVINTMHATSSVIDNELILKHLLDLKSGPHWLMPHRPQCSQPSGGENMSVMSHGEPSASFASDAGVKPLQLVPTAALQMALSRLSDKESDDSEPDDSVSLNNTVFWLPKATAKPLSCLRINNTKDIAGKVWLTNFNKVALPASQAYLTIPPAATPLCSVSSSSIIPVVSATPLEATAGSEETSRSSVPAGTSGPSSSKENGTGTVKDGDGVSIPPLEFKSQSNGPRPDGDSSLA